MCITSKLTSAIEIKMKSKEYSGSTFARTKNKVHFYDSITIKKIQNKNRLE